MQVREVNPEVFFVTDRIASIRGIDLEFLKDKAERSPRRRARVCTHRDVEDQLHEMLVVLKRDTYLRPEKHLTKIESYHIIQGQADVVIFDEAGEIADVVPLGDYGSGGRFYYRLSETSFYHTLVVRSDSFVYHEAATGPFRRSDAVFAGWAPEEGDAAGRRKFMERLAIRAKDFLSTLGPVRAGN